MQSFMLDENGLIRTLTPSPTDRNGVKCQFLKHIWHTFFRVVVLMIAIVFMVNPNGLCQVIGCKAEVPRNTVSVDVGDEHAEIGRAHV